MRLQPRTFASIAGLATVIALAPALPASASTVGDTDGCTPGYWKNHTAAWVEQESPRIVIPHTTPLSAIYPATAGTAFGSATMLEALGFGGGGGVDGASRILLRAATAAYLNAAHDSLAYPLSRYGTDGLIARVNSALLSHDRATMLALATELDIVNNLGCPL